MPVQKHLLLIDPLKNLKPVLDTSLNLGRALLQRSAEVWVTTAPELLWNNHACMGPQAFCHRLAFIDHQIERPVLNDSQLLSLRSFTSIQMRKEPPFNEDYITTTLFLEDAAAHGVHVLNSPAALRRFNEKLTILELGEAVRPALVSCDSHALLRFMVETANGDAIVKPLGLYGGRGVERLQSKDYANESDLRAKFEQLTNGGQLFRIIQAFDQAVFQGEVRAFVLDREPLAWCLKVPPAGNFLANTSSGATLHPYEPSPVELQRVRDASSLLLAQGLRILGFDLIGGYISEVNVTSPRLLKGQGDNRDYYSTFADWLMAMSS